MKPEVLEPKVQGVPRGMRHEFMIRSGHELSGISTLDVKGENREVKEGKKNDRKNPNSSAHKKNRNRKRDVRLIGIKEL